MNVYLLTHQHKWFSYYNMKWLLSPISNTKLKCQTVHQLAPSSVGHVCTYILCYEAKQVAIVTPGSS